MDEKVEVLRKVEQEDNIWLQIGYHRHRKF
jgi:hypothetical protein